MTSALKIDFVSDVSCPWCVIGLTALNKAMQQVAAEISVDLHFQPFELNPTMGPEGADVTAYITQKYGISKQEAEANRAAISQRGAELGFTFSGTNASGGGRSRIYNTFDAHRLLHWADAQGQGLQKRLKEALFKAYFTDGRNPSSREVLLSLVGDVGLDAARAAEILGSDEYAAEVRERASYYTGQGIHSVPAIIINDRHLISGGQPVEVFERALRQVASQG
jgi:predicted DsbA family dithiol-disulfide isomerase